MKRSVISLFIVALMAVSFVVVAGENTSFVDDYKISIKENFEPSQAFQQSWEITYGESKRPVQVLLKETKRGNEYLVRSNYFEVKYVNTKTGFGVRPLKVSEARVPASLQEQVVSQSGMDSQRVISASSVEQEKALKLIAGFLPELVNTKFKNILN